MASEIHLKTIPQKSMKGSSVCAKLRWKCALKLRKGMQWMKLHRNVPLKPDIGDASIDNHFLTRYNIYIADFVGLMQALFLAPQSADISATFFVFNFFGFRQKIVKYFSFFIDSTVNNLYNNFIRQFIGCVGSFLPAIATIGLLFSIVTFYALLLMFLFIYYYQESPLPVISKLDLCGKK